MELSSALIEQIKKLQSINFDSLARIEEANDYLVMTLF
jgi:hypothetical protein